MAAEGWYRNPDGLLEKKYDPHAALRAKQYEKRLREHQMNGGGQQSYETNDPSTVGARSEVVRARAAQKREEKINKARKFNQRHERHVKEIREKHKISESHREHERYMNEFHQAFGLPAREEPHTMIHEKTATDPMSYSRISSYDTGSESDIRNRWRRGPLDPRGGLIDASDRPLLCLSVSAQGRDCVVGSADHAAYGFDPSRAVHEDTQKPKRTLYSKRSGHAEWVTAVSHIDETHVLTAGMDGKLILWTGMRATELQSQGASISTLLVDAHQPVALSCAYDGTSKLWQIKNGKHQDSRCIATFASGSSAPALCASWRDGLCLIGDRDGAIATYSTQSLSLLAVWKQQCGHVVSLLATRKNIFISGAQDGRLRFWDQRVAKTPCIHTIDAHRTPRGAGAIGSLIEIYDTEYLFASAGADGRVKVWDSRNPSTGALHNYRCEAQPHCLAALGPMLVSGDAKGNILCHDTLSSTDSACLWGLGANRGAVRALEARPDLLVAVGDDGNALAWSF